MNYFLIALVAVLTVAVSARPKIDATLVEASISRLRGAHTSCNANPATAVDEAALKLYIKKEGPAPENMNAHALCVSKTLGWQNEDGTVNRENIVSRAQSIYGDNEKLNHLVDECTAAQATPEETATHLIACYRKNLPTSTPATTR